MKDQDKKWEVLGKATYKGEDYLEKIADQLLKNRNIKKGKKKEFFTPISPKNLKTEDFRIDKNKLKIAIKRLHSAIDKKEKIIIYGDYDTDGVCATAILWETLFSLGADVLPYIPDRFEEGYGINPQTVRKIKSKNPNLKLIVTVDNGIVAFEAVEEANKLGIDVIVTDHHQKGKNTPPAYAILHTDKTSGSGISWFLSKKLSTNYQDDDKLALAAIGTIADQIPLVGINRSIAKYGLDVLGKTEKVGLIELFKEAGLYKGSFSQAKIGTYEVNYIIAPRINAMGRLEHAIDSLRLICTKNSNKAKDLAQHLGVTNRKRQKIVEEVLQHAKKLAAEKDWKGVIVLSDKSYHEGVIGLAAGKLVEAFGRPALVISEGKKYCKGSARSIPGFNVIEAIRQAGDLLEAAGGHPMAAGFKLRTENLKEFTKKMEVITKPLLTNDLLQKKLKIDLEIDFSVINEKLYELVKSFEPFGLGNPNPSFVIKDIDVIEARTVGSGDKHLKLKLGKAGKMFDAIGFGFGDKVTKLNQGFKIDAVVNIDENVWNGYRNLQLKVKDIHST